MQGVVIGIVKDLDDPNSQGRIKVSFPWNGDQESAWAPISAPLAGKDRGLWFMPEVGDEALVAFEQGDFNHPFILGFLWNGSDLPPATDPKERVLVTPGGHELRFHDTDGSKKITLKTSGGLEIVMDDAASSITMTGGGRSIKLASGQVQIS